ncbi:MAG: hypothetical protein K2N87_06680 [Eubacterium sp.]|nr:hypothetical protein [Eubacterium sp.]
MKSRNKWEKNSIDVLLKSYPRRRPVLPESYQKIYERHYQENRNGATKVSAYARRVEGWLHRKIAKSARGGEEDFGNWCRDIKSDQL